MSDYQELPFVMPLPDAYKGCTWDGMTFRIDSVDEGDTEFAATLASAQFQIQDSAGNAILTLSSSVSGEVTLNETAPNEWDVTVESRIITIAAGNYTYALETVDSDGVKKPLQIGSQRVNPEPII
jgi:hypothetical protein